MWPEFLIAFVLFALAVAGMAIGVIVARKRLKGSCGGLAGLRDEHGRPMCEACSHPSPECRGENTGDESSEPSHAPQDEPAHSTR
jgi:uncharacterized protein